LINGSSNPALFDSGEPLPSALSGDALLDLYDNNDASQCHGSLGDALRSAARHIDLEFGELFSAHQLTCEQWTILTFLRKKPMANAANLSRSNHYNAGSLSRAIDTLVRRGLVVRERSTDDRRVVLLSLTAAGEELLQHLLPKVIAAWDVFLKEFSRPEIKLLTTLLQRLAP
jgi:DNA-binding MarR family transcriptional regulator